LGWAQHDQIQEGRYVYDEADYMTAASLGLGANAWDVPSRSIVDFVSIGLDAVTHKGNRASLSQIAREGTDVNFYRHTHGPFYYYWLYIFSFWGHSEGAIRALSLVFPVLTGLIIYAGCIWIIPGAQGKRVGLLSAALFCWSPAVVGTRELAPHLAFCLCVVGSLFCAAKATETGARKYWYGALSAAGLAFSTLEVAFVLVITLAVTGWRERARLRLDRRGLVQSIGVFVATTLVVWPAGLLKLAALKSYLFMAYLAIGRQASWGDVTFAQTWATRLEKSPVEWLLIGGALALWVAGPKYRAKTAGPFLLFGGLMVLTMLRVNTTSLRYSVPFLPALHVFTGMVLAGPVMDLVREERLRWAGVAVFVALLGGNMTHFVALNPMRPDISTAAIVQDVQVQMLFDKRLLVPQDQMPTLRYYFPRATIKGFLDIAAEAPEQYDAVLYPAQTRFSVNRP